MGASIPTTIPGTSVIEPSTGTPVGTISLPTGIPGTYVPYVAGPPAPSFVVGGINAAASTVALAGFQVGDWLIGATAGINPAASLNGWLQLSFPAAAVGAVATCQFSAKQIAPQDSSPLTLPAGGSATGLAAAIFRSIFSTDGIAASKTGAAGTSPTSNTFTTIEAGDVIVNVIGFDVDSGHPAPSYTPSTGFTLAAMQPGANGSNFGCAIEYKLGAPAGVQPAASGGALSQSVAWAMWAFALAPLTV